MSGWIAGAVVAGSALSAYGASQGGKKAAKGQEKAAELSLQGTREQLALQKEMWEQGREDVAPWREAGLRGLSLYEMASYSPFEFNLEQDPIYQKQLEEQTKTLERSAAAKGGLLSGGTLRDLREATASELSAAYGRQYGQYQDTLNRYGAIAGIGMGANQTLGSLGAQYGTNMAQIGAAGTEAQSQAAANIGAINAASTQGMYGAIGQGMSSFGMMYGLTDGFTKW